MMLYPSGRGTRKSAVGKGSAMIIVRVTYKYSLDVIRVSFGSWAATERFLATIDHSRYEVYVED